LFKYLRSQFIPVYFTVLRDYLQVLFMFCFYKIELFCGWCKCSNENSSCKNIIIRTQRRH